MIDILATQTTINGSKHYFADGTIDDDGQISCFCGLNEDDGNTVACDECNKWQHIRCYYPQWANGDLPEDLQHWCVDCRPREYDAQGARIRQISAKAQKEANGVKRPTSKSKKKPLTNGWPRHETSASPREGPPTKRPKTTHRPSNSTSARKRSASTLHQRSISASPETLSQTYSPEFLSAYQNDDYTRTNANCLDNLEISAKLSGWLGNPEEVLQITNGKGLPDIFQRYDGDMNVIDPPVDLIELQELHDDRVKTADGIPAMWKIATLKEPLTTHACIGELRGHVGFKEDYKADPSNRWAILKHPEPFVFFHPNLPICVDARQEGTMVRYIRRSCDPNAELKVIITGAADYHFCFIATRDIAAGEEVAIAWDCARTILDMIGGRKISKEGIDSLQQWVSLVLSNCGPCACKRPDCLMAHFDKRFEEASRPKVRRRKETQISPLNTTVNSRSGSEIRKFDDDDSSSGKESSPNTHYSGQMPELSERERKKLAKEEEMFRRQEEQGRKKKRTSGGPSIIPAKSPGIPKRMDTSSGRVQKRRPKSSKTEVIVKRSESAYVDSAIQCEMDPHETLAYTRKSTSLTRRRVTPLHQRLLDRCAQSNALWHKRRPLRRPSKADPDGDVDMSPDVSRPSAEVQSFHQSPEQELHSSPEVHPQQSPELQQQTASPTEPMKLDMPPPPLFTQSWMGTPSSTIVQSPATSAPPVLSPSVQAAVTPLKKKLSLSDYTRRSKAKETEVKPDREASPSSSVSGPQSTEVKHKDSMLEDVIMEDASNDGAVV